VIEASKLNPLFMADKLLKIMISKNIIKAVVGFVDGIDGLWLLMAKALSGAQRGDILFIFMGHKETKIMAFYIARKKLE